MFPRFNENQLKIISSIFADAGQVFFGATVVPFLFNLDKIEPWIVVLGIASSFACWVISVAIAQEVKI